MIHRTPSDPDRYREFQEALEGETVPALARVASGLAAGAILAFIPVDFVFYPDQAASFAMLRVLCALAQLGAGHWLVRTHPTLALKTLAFVTGATLLVVTAATGGPTSPYYSGLLLLFVALPVVVPLNARAMVGILGVLVLGFASLPLLETGPLDARTFGLHTVFLALAGGIATVTAAALDGMRFADHERRREIERARDELAQLDDAKTRFTANVHHELRTPLTLMLAPLEGMRAGDYGPVPHEAERPLRTMHVNGKRLLKLINNLLDLAKLESAQFEVTRAPLSVAELLEEVVEGALPMAERKQIRLVCEARDDVPDCFADRAALDKVLVNLVGNALKFTDAGGEVGVGAAPAEGGLEVWVRDTGSSACSTASRRWTPPRPAATRGPASGCRSRASWWSCTGAASGRPARASVEARRCASSCRSASRTRRSRVRPPRLPATRAATRSPRPPSPHGAAPAARRAASTIRSQTPKIFT